MTTFLDSSALFAAMNDAEPHHAWSVAQIAACRADGPIVITDIVYCELAAGMPTKGETDTAVAEWALERITGDDVALFRAGQAYSEYKDKKRQADQKPKSNVLPDFLIGAVAEVEGYPLITTNQKDFIKYFPALSVIHP